MFAQAHYPVILLPQELDQYLARGWFRMGETVFTTNFLSFHKQFYSAVWLRIKLSQWEDEKAFLKLQKQNKHFRSEITTLKITPAHERLFSHYREKVSFEASASLVDLLYGGEEKRLFDSWMVNVFDGDALIASGVFDRGEDSAAGITSFYDPAYKKYSLGRYLIYQKIAFCKKVGHTFFYPGYFVPGYKPFDYKLSIGTPTLEYLPFASGIWENIRTYQPEAVPLVVMKEKLKLLQDLVEENGQRGAVFFYEFHSANLIADLQEFDLFDYPVFFHIPVSNLVNGGLLVVYNVNEMCYNLLYCYSIWKSDEPHEGADRYEGHLLKMKEKLCSAETPGEILRYLSSVRLTA